MNVKSQRLESPGGTMTHEKSLYGLNECEKPALLVAGK